MAKKTTPKTKSELMTALAESTGLTKKQAQDTYEALLEIVYAGAKSKDGIMLPGLGKFTNATRKARMCRNPRNPEETFKVPAKKIVKFSQAKALKDSVLPKKKS